MAVLSPRAPNGHYSGVCIDDKLSLQVFPHVVPEGASQMEVPGRDLEACAQASEAYEAVGLMTHPRSRSAGLVFFTPGEHSLPGP